MKERRFRYTRNEHKDGFWQDTEHDGILLQFIMDADDKLYGVMLEDDGGIALAHAGRLKLVVDGVRQS